MTSVIKHHENIKPFVYGLITGGVSCVIFNPLDKALYEMVLANELYNFIKKISS
jgi:hypothetical protein